MAVEVLEEEHQGKETGGIDNEKSNKVLIGVGVVVAIIVVWVFSTIASLNTARESCNRYESNIKVQVKRRYDLIPNVLSTVKAAAQHEKDVYTDIAEARSKLGGIIDSGSRQEISDADSELQAALGRLIAIQEDYPKLTADEQYTALIDELEGCENRISVARLDYNDAVMEYNLKVTNPLSSWIASIRGMETKNYIEIREEEEKVPEVDFSE